MKLSTRSPMQINAPVTLGSCGESEEVRLCLDYLRCDDKVLLAGCGMGSLACWCASIVGPEGLICYEAQPALVEYARWAVKVNEQQLDVRQGALTLEDGPVPFTTLPTRTWAGSGLVGAYPDGATVPGVDTNRILREEEPSVLVLDIEGAEFGLIPELVMPTVRLIILEIHSNYATQPEQERMWGYLTDRFRVAKVFHFGDGVKQFVALERDLS